LRCGAKLRSAFAHAVCRRACRIEARPDSVGKAREAGAPCHRCTGRLCPPYGSTHPTALRSSETGGGPARCGAGPPHISQPVSRVLYGARPGPARDGHSSGTPVARRFEQPTRTAGSGHRSWSACRRWRDDRLHAVPIRFCSRWGLPCRSRCRKRGALLPHRFTLTAEPPPSSSPLAGERFSVVPSPATGEGKGGGRGGLFSVALSLGSPPPDVIRHRMSMEPGLSSPAPPYLRESGAERRAWAAVRPTDRSRNGVWRA
jgi:hypothetical protein